MKGIHGDVDCGISLGMLSLTRCKCTTENVSEQQIAKSCRTKNLYPHREALGFLLFSISLSCRLKIFPLWLLGICSTT